MPGGAEASGQVMLGAFFKALGMCLSSRVEALFKGFVAGTVWPSLGPVLRLGCLPASASVEVSRGWHPEPPCLLCFPDILVSLASSHCSWVFTPGGTNLGN